MNDSTRKTFITRAKIIGFIRDFLNQRDFLEVGVNCHDKRYYANIPIGPNANDE